VPEQDGGEATWDRQDLGDIRGGLLLPVEDIGFS
jgi:hypothetical protein